MEYLYLVLAVLAGTTAPIQAGINAQLQSAWAGNAVLASFVSFVVGTLALGGYLVVSGIGVPALKTGVPWWHWTGGVLGAFFVTMTIFLAHRLGAAALFALVVGGQLLASLFLDHYGLLGYQVQPLGWQRVLGVALVVAGVVLIRRY